MKKLLTVRHEFVEYVPDVLEEGVLYICVGYATTAHNCFCGCGSEVVAPLSPKDWQLIFDGETVALEPSIGNWNFACQSHYWIDRDRVRWARRWTREEIDRARVDDHEMKQRVGSRRAEPQWTLERNTWRALRAKLLPKRLP